MSRLDLWLELKYSSLQELWWMCKYRHKHPGNKKSWVRISRGLEQHTRQFVPTETDHQNLEDVSLQQSVGCGRPSAQETGGNSPVRHKAAPKPKPKLISIGFSPQVWKMTHAEALTKRDCEFVHISQHFTKILRHTRWHEADGALRGNHVWTNMPSTEHTQHLDTEKWIDALGRSVEKSSMENWEDHHGAIIYIRAVQRHSHGARINPTLLSFTKRPLKWKEHIFHTGSSSNSKCISDNGLWDGGLSLRRTRQACFLSRVNPQDSSSRQRTTNWTGQVHEPRMVLYKQSYRPDHGCIFLSIYDANLVFHQRSNDALLLCNNMFATALDKMVTFSHGLLFEKKPTTSTKPESTRGDRVDLRTSSQTEEPRHLDERDAKSSHLQLGETSLASSKQIDDDRWFDQELLTEECRKTSITTLCTSSRFRNACMLYKTVLWNDMIF